MEAPRRDFDHLREHSIGLPSVLLQSIVEDETITPDTGALPSPA